MPEVKPGESRNSYMGRCVRQVMAEGLDQKAAVGKCEGMYDSHVKKSREAVRKANVVVDSLVGASQAERRFEYDRVYKAEMASRLVNEFSNGRVEKAAYEEGHISHRSAGDFQKRGGAWQRMRTSSGGPGGDDQPGSESLTRGQGQMLDEQAKGNQDDLRVQYRQFKEDMGPDDKTTFQDFARTITGESEGLFDTQGESGGDPEADGDGPLGSALDSAAEVKPEHLHAMADKLQGAQHQANAREIMSQANDAYAKALGLAPAGEAGVDDEEDDEDSSDDYEFGDDEDDEDEDELAPPPAKRSADPRMDAQIKANRESDDALRRAGYDPDENPADRRARNARKSMMKDAMQDELREVDKLFTTDGDGDPLGDALRLAQGAKADVSKDSHGKDCDCDDCKGVCKSDALGKVLKSL